MTTAPENISLPLQPQGFGEYDLPDGLSYKDALKTQKIHYFCLLLIHGSIVASLIVIYNVALAAFPILAVAPLLMVPSVVHCIKNYFKYRAIENLPKPTRALNLKPENFDLPKLNEFSKRDYSAHICQNSLESNQWKLELLSHANHNIFLCGSYCGGPIFDEALHRIEQRMDLKQQLKTFIIASDYFLTEENRNKLQYLQQKYPERFHLHIFKENNDTINLATDQWMLSVIHVKMCCIDYGKYFITGGSGLETKWVNEETAAIPESADSGFHFSKTLVFPKYMNDMDFVFHSLNDRGIGGTIYLEMIKLFAMFDNCQDENSSISWQPSYTRLSFPCSQIDTRIPSYHASSLCSDLEIKPFVSEPQREDNPFLKRLIEQIDNASSSIILNHMYFHPSPPLLNSLAEASKRGVKITIITNDQYEDSPVTHRFYADFSKSQGLKLFNLGLPENINFWLYRKSNTTDHKKVIIVDNLYTFVGSSNISYRSDKTDYELNLEVKSEIFAEKTAENINADLAFCEELPKTGNIYAPHSMLSHLKGTLQKYIFSSIL